MLTIGLDIGTSNCKAVALSTGGTVVASETAGYRLISSQPGYAEQDTEEIWQAVQFCLRSLVSKVDRRNIKAIGLSGAMHSLVPVSTEGNALAPAQTWADQRAADHTTKLQEKYGHLALYERTGCPLVSFYYPAKLCWWKEERKDIYKQAAMFVNIKDLIMYRMTGRWYTDISLASSTGLLNIEKMTWDSEALRIASISDVRLPQLIEPASQAGWLLPDLANTLGLTGGTPVIAGASDGALANFGCGAIRSGQAVITVGTSGAVRRVSGRPLLDPAGRTWCYVFVPGRWFVGGAINNAGLALKWVRDKFYSEYPGESGFDRLKADADGVEPGAEGVFFLPYLAGERSPHWNANARAILHGLRIDHDRAHIARSVMEGVAFCLADVWEAIPADLELPVRLTGTITRSPNWAKIIADVLGVPLAVYEAADASSIGAAMLAFRVIGEGDTLEELAGQTEPERVIEPDVRLHARYLELHSRFQELYRRNYGSV